MSSLVEWMASVDDKQHRTIEHCTGNGRLPTLPTSKGTGNVCLEVPVRERERERQGLVLSPELRRGIAHGGGGEALS